jgi:hypothetical protein
MVTVGMVFGKVCLKAVDVVGRGDRVVSVVRKNGEV